MTAAIPNLVEDVDTVADLERREERPGRGRLPSSTSFAPVSPGEVALLAGGLGGSRFARALTETLDPREVTRRDRGRRTRGLGPPRLAHLDTILYTLAGVLDETKGWGRAEETWNARDGRATRPGRRRGFSSATATSGCTSRARRRCAAATRAPP